MVGWGCGSRNGPLNKRLNKKWTNLPDNCPHLPHPQLFCHGNPGRSPLTQRTHRLDVSPVWWSCHSKTRSWWLCWRHSPTSSGYQSCFPQGFFYCMLLLLSIWHNPKKIALGWITIGIWHWKSHWKFQPHWKKHTETTLKALKKIITLKCSL